MAERMAARAVAQAPGCRPSEVLAGACARPATSAWPPSSCWPAHAPARGRPPWRSEVVFDDPAPDRRGRRGRLPGPQAGRGWSGCWSAATPLEARYLVRTVTGSAAARDRHRHHPRRPGRGPRRRPQASRPVLERAYNICSDLGLVAATLVAGGLAEVERDAGAGRQPGPADARPADERARPRSWPSWAGPARPSTSTTASGSRPTAPPTGASSCSPGAWNGSRASSPTWSRLLDGGPRARGRRSWRARWSPPTRSRASCARSRRSCSAAASTASPRRSTTCRSACSASTCCTPTART